MVMLRAAALVVELLATTPAEAALTKLVDDNVAVVFVPLI
jgi:hypothetical protein